MQVAVHVHQDDGFDDGSFHNAPCVVSLRYHNENPCGSTTLEQTELAMTQISFFSPGKHVMGQRINLLNMHRVLRFCHFLLLLSNVFFLAETRRSLFILMNLPSGYDTADCWYLPTSLCVVDKNSPYWPLRRTFLFSLKFGRGQNAQNVLRTRTLSRLAHERGEISWLYLPTHIRFQIGEEHVTCCPSKPTNSLRKQQLELFLLFFSGNFVCQPASNKIIFRSFFYYFWAGGITKRLITGPVGKNEFVSPRP